MNRDEFLAAQARIVVAVGVVISTLAVGAIVWAIYQFIRYG